MAGGDDNSEARGGGGADYSKDAQSPCNAGEQNTHPVQHQHGPLSSLKKAPEGKHTPTSLPLRTPKAHNLGQVTATARRRRMHESNVRGQNPTTA